MSISLSDADVRRIVSASEQLARPADTSRPDEGSGPFADFSSTPQTEEREGGSWAEAADAVAHAAGTDRAVIFLPTQKEGMWMGSSSVPEVAEACSTSLIGIRDGLPEYADPLLTDTTARRVRQGGGVYLGRELASPGIISKSAFYNDVLVPNGFRHLMWMSIPLVAGEASLMIGFSHLSEPQAEEKARLTLRLLLPSFRSGLAYLGRDAKHGHPANEIELHLAADGTLIRASPAAQLALRCDPGRAALLAGMQDAVRRAHGADRLHLGVPVPPVDVRTAAGPYIMHLAPHPSTGWIVRLDPPEGRRMSKEELQRVFGLTPRQVDVALLIADGRSNDEIAAALYISPHTAHHHTEQVLAKLAAKRREDVNALLQEGWSR